MEPAIKASNIKKQYGEVQAVNGISFQVNKGCLFGFLGPNGAGKSTTQRMLTGVIYPDKGDIQIMGYSMFKSPIKAKELMGVVPEQANVYTDLSAWDNLMFIGEIYNVDKKQLQERAKDLLNQFNLYEKRYLKTRGFSKGMKQRLLLCMALINDPQVLFLDEPTSGLDIESRKLIRDIIIEYKNKGKTIFLTTHEIEEASKLCDEIAIINHGELAVIDTPYNLKQSISELNSLEFVLNSKIDKIKFRELPHVNEVKETGKGYVVYTAMPGKVIPELINLIQNYGLEIISLKTQEPALEEVFLHFINENRTTKAQSKKEGDQHDLIQV